MNKELELLVSEHFPLMRRELYPETDFGYWGYMIPDGWFPLVVQFAKALKEISPEGLVIYQIKEKMNCLVICCECDDEEASIEALDDLENLIEQLSQSICGRCGERLVSEHRCHSRWKRNDLLVKWATDYMGSLSIQPLEDSSHRNAGN